MTGRLRERGTFAPGGGQAYRAFPPSPPIYNVTQANNLGYVFRDQCNDSVGRGVDHSMEIIHRNIILDLLNGEEVAIGLRRFYVNWVPVSQLSIGHEFIAGIPSVQSDATKTLTRTHPGRARVSLPVAIGELRDLPHMVKQAGDFIRSVQKSRNQFERASLFSRATPQQFLAYQFGWKPFLSDLRKLITFQETVDRRVKELQRLYSNKGLKRRIELGNWSAHRELNVTIASELGSFADTRKSIDTKVKRWATVRWLPLIPFQYKSQDQMHKEAVKAVFGLSLQPSDVWELMPWTWLFDWFSNFGDILEATNNRILCSPGPVNVMTNWQTNIRWVRTNSNWIRGGNSYASLETKQRTVSSGLVPTVELPFLNATQFSILGALAVTKARGFRS